jgi:hypothetical protein
MEKFYNIIYMTDFLTELEELFSTFKEQEQLHLKQQYYYYDSPNKNESLFEILQGSKFFMEQYVQQEFKRTNRFKEKTYYNFRGYPVELNKKKEMRFNFTVKKMNKESREYIDENFDVNKLEEIKVKELKFFTQGSKTKTQFECWTPMVMFLWWRTLRESYDPKQEWKIMDAVFFLFINQISQIINTYVINFKLEFYSFFSKENKKNLSIVKSYVNKYKINKYNSKNKINNPYLKSLFYLKKYLEELDKFYNNGGEYGLLLNVQLLYYEFYEFELYLDSIRHSNNDFRKVRLLRKSNYNSDFYLQGLFQNNNETEHKYVLEEIPESIYRGRRTVEKYNHNNGGYFYKNLFKIFNNTLEENNYSLIIFLSYAPNESKYISLYSIPVIPILGREHDTHEGSTYTSLQHISHDLSHSNYLIYFLKNLYQNLKKNEDIQDFFTRTLVLEELNKKQSNKNNKEYLIYKDSQKLLWWFLHEKKFNLKLVAVSNNVNERVAIHFFNIEKLKEKLKDLITQVKAKHNINYQPKFYDPIGLLPKKYFNKHKINIEEYRKCVIESIIKLIEICDFVLKQNKKYNYRNENNNINNRAAIYGNINNNKVNKKVNKYLEKHPEFTMNDLQKYANDYKIGKIYNTSNELNINRFRNDFIKRVKNRKIQKNISNHISKFIENNQELSNNNINKLGELLKNKKKLEELKKENPNSSNIELLHKLLQKFSNKYLIPNLNRNTNKNKSTNVETLSNQRKAFIKGIVINPNGSPLTNNNFSN